jgi:hypothetical protein
MAVGYPFLSTALRMLEASCPKNVSDGQGSAEVVGPFDWRGLYIYFPICLHPPPSPCPEYVSWALSTFTVVLY